MCLHACKGLSRLRVFSCPIASPIPAQVALFVSVLFVLRWPLAIMENVSGLLSGGWLGRLLFG